MGFLGPRYKSDFTRDEAVEFLHEVFNERHHSDKRSELNTYTTRLCLLNTIEGFLVELRRKRAVLEEEDDHQTNTEYHDMVKRIAQLEKDKNALQADREAHLPHYAFVMLVDAFIEGLVFPPSEGSVNEALWSAKSASESLGEALTLRLLNDSAIADKFVALDNMVANLKSDAGRTHDSLDRLVSADDMTRYRQIKSPDALYRVLIQPPPQTGSAAIRGQQESPPEAPSPDGGGS